MNLSKKILVARCHQNPDASKNNFKLTTILAVKKTTHLRLMQESVMKCVHISAEVQSRLNSLKKSGKAGISLAQKVAHVIEGLAFEGARRRLNAVGSLTKFGEKRIKKCRKFDLGCGFRLITLQQGDRIFILFLGAHDECQRWLDNNSRLKRVSVDNKALFEACPSNHPPDHSDNIDPADIRQDVADEERFKLSDQDLRHVFCGLVEAVARRPIRKKGA